MKVSDENVTYVELAVFALAIKKLLEHQLYDDAIEVLNMAIEKGNKRTATD